MEENDGNDGIPNIKRKRRCYEDYEQEYGDLDELHGSAANVVGRVRNMVFNTIDEAERFYIAYGREMGFDIRSQKVETIKSTKIVQSVKWVCNREGFRKKGTNELFRKRESKPETRCGCNAYFRVAYHQASGKYRVTSFEPKHNHQLATSENRHLLRCNRYLTSADKSLMSFMTEIGFSPSSAMDFIRNLIGEHAELPFKRKDGFNFVNKEKMDSIKDGDVNAAFSMLAGMKLNDPGFELKHTVNSKGELGCMFWSDSHSKAEYKAFGDVILIDSTYQTNEYHYPLAIISGVNNHGRNCIFGAGILCDETIASYRWLLRKFVNAMNGKIPSAVLSDQDGSICQAIKDEFGEECRHRLCCWHLGRNAQQNVSKAGFAGKFVKLAKKNCSKQEFEKRWAELVQQYGVADNSWVIKIYEKKKMWSEAYFSGVFLAGMSTTQRAESINSLMKLYLKPTHSLTEFLKTYHRTVQQMRRNFVDMQLDDEFRKPDARKHGVFSKLEEHAANVCTKKVFKKIRENILAEQALIPVSKIKFGEEKFIFTFRENMNKGEIRCSVAIDMENESFHCDCMMLESTGVPCPHILSGFKDRGITFFPNKSIHRRWLVETGQSLRMTFAQSLAKPDMQRTQTGLIQKENICQKLPHDDKSKFTNLLNTLRKFSEDLKDPRAGTNGGVGPRVNTMYNIRDPVKIQSKGAPKRRTQHCTICNRSGHNCRACPDDPANKDRRKNTRRKNSNNINYDELSYDPEYDDGVWEEPAE